MKRAIKISLRIILIFMCFLLIIAIISLRPVDYTPYFQTDYYQRTIQRLAELETQLVLPEACRIEVGSGVAHITPRIGTPLAGYSARKSHPSTGVHDSLFAKAIAIKSGVNEVVLTGIDGLIVSRRMAEAVMKIVTPKSGLKRHQILFGASHTHSGAGAWEAGYLGEIFAGEYNQAVFEFLITQMAGAILKAHASLKQAAGGFNSIHLPQFTRNRLAGKQGTIDPEFTFGRFRRDDETNIILGSYSAHATTISSKNMQYSGGYPGYWERALENQFPGMALFFAGGVGSHGPVGKGKSFERARFIGEAIAESLLVPLSNLHFKKEMVIFSFGLIIDLPEPHLRISDSWRVAPWLSKLFVKERDSYLQIVAIGKTLIIGAPGDFSGELAAQLKDFAFRRGFRLIVTSFNGSYLGYIIPSKYYHYDEYESRMMSFFGPTMGDYILDLMRSMIEMVIQKIDY